MVSLSLLALVDTFSPLSLALCISQKQAQARPYIDQVLSYPAVRVRVELREQRQQQVDLMSQIAQMQEETTELRTQVDSIYSRLGY